MMWLVLLTSIIAVGLVTVITYRAGVSWIVKSTILMLFLTLGLVAYVDYTLNLGAPIKSKPHDDVVYIHHYIDFTSANIALWAYDDQLGHRLYVYPYTREDAATLSNAAKRNKEGRAVGISYGGDGSPIVTDLAIPQYDEVKE
jgi:hypothetical protein